MNRQPITVAIMARNEDWFIEHTIQSALKVSADVLVGDMGSTDRTREISIGLGARLVDVPVDLMVNQGWAVCRNFMNRLTRHQWVLTLDADETLSDEAITTLNAPKWTWDTSVIITPTRTYQGQPGMTIEEAMKMPCEIFPHRRMFDISKVSWCGFVHEEPVWLGTDKPALDSVPTTDITRNHFTHIRPVSTSTWKWKINAQLFLRAISGHLTKTGVNPWWFDKWVPENLIELKALAKEFFDSNPCYGGLRDHIQW